VTPTKDATVHDGEFWRAYKRIRVLNQGRKVLEKKETRRALPF
jgi:hypothetical protein